MAFAGYAPYVDPLLLVVLGLAHLPIPSKSWLDSLKEVIGKHPEAVTAVIEKKAQKQSLSTVPYKHIEVPN